MSSSGTSTTQQNSSSEEIQIVDERKRKRMESNRESARRSRMRKQKHLDDLSAQIGNLKKVNVEMLKDISLTNQKYVEIESENCILRAQMGELSNRLQSLNEINTVLGSNPNPNPNHNYNYNHNNNHDYGYNYDYEVYGEGHFGNHLLMNPLNCMNQGIMASADVFYY